MFTLYSIFHWVPGALTPRLNRPEREGRNTTRFNAEVKNAWSYTSTPQYVFKA